MTRSVSNVVRTVFHECWGPVRNVLTAILFLGIAAVFYVESI
jgi:hypothetical protein